MAQRTARIIRDEEVMGGEPVIEETRITVLRVHALVHERGLPARGDSSDARPQHCGRSGGA
jgi:hypothetical protein